MGGERAGGSLAPASAIETGFPVEQVNRLAALEAYNKHHYRPTNYQHKWWARRLGSVFRTVCIAALSPPDLDAEDVWARYATPVDVGDAVVLDPFMGGGTTGQEATRVGARFVGADCNPVAWFVARMALAPRPDDLGSHFRGVLDAARDEVRPYYVTRCPTCDDEVGAQFYLWVALDEDGPARVYDSLVVDRDDEGATVVCPACHALAEAAAPADATCPDCGRGFDATASDVRAPVEAPRVTFGGDGRPAYEPYAVKYDCDACGRGFAAFDDGDAARFRAAVERYREREDALPVPDRAIPAGGEKTRDLRTRGYRRWRELFSPRQLLALGTLLSAVLRVDDDLARAYLALVLSASLEFNSMFCSYKGDDPSGPGAVRHAFSHHAFVHPGEPLENNPLGTRPRQSGTVPALFEYRLRRGLAYQEAPVERVLGPDGGVAEKRTVPGERIGGEPASSVEALLAGEGTHLLHCGDGADLPDADALSGAVDAVVTDPPYFDSVQYGELSDFFYVWLRRALGRDHPGAFAATSAVSAAEAVGNPTRRKSLDDYRDVLGAVFASSAETLAADGVLVFTFHHAAPEPWGAVLEALDGAGLRVVRTYPVRGENRRSVHIDGQRAVLLDSLVVCRPGPGAGEATWSAVREAVERSTRERVRRFHAGDGEDLSRLDASVVARGACLAAYSRHGRVADGDGPVGPREAMRRLEPLVAAVNDEQF